MFGRKVTKREDGAKVIDSKRTTKVKYPNGEMDVHHKRSGKVDQWRFTTEDNQ